MDNEREREYSRRYRLNKANYVRLSSWITKTQKAFLKKLAKVEGRSEAEIVRDAIYKVHKIK